MSEYPFDPDFLPDNLRHIKTEERPSVGLTDGRMDDVPVSKSTVPFRQR